MKTSNRSNLNQEQRQAVSHRSGPLLIIAGAGTGKTTVITERIKFLIENQSTPPDRICAVTFTDKAAGEMLERLDVVMPLGYEEPWLGTFHSVCDRIMRNEALEIGLDPTYKVINSIDQWILIRQHLFDFKLKYYRPLGNPTKFISALLNFFSRAQDEDINPEKLLHFVKQKKAKAVTDVEIEEAEKRAELATAFTTYQELKIQESLLDFGDLITQTLRLFRTRPSILKKYQGLFQHILVDEFQDTNFAQYQVIKLLAPAHTNPNLIVVGDDDQSIYKFRGAAISNILDFKSDYPKAKEIVLRDNYRSVKSILAASYQLIQHNNPDRLEVKLNVNKKLTSIRAKKTTEPPRMIQVASGENEVDFVLQKILELVAKEDYSYKDFAILARANSYLDSFVSGFKRSGIPYQIIGNRGLFDQEEVRTLIHCLRVIADSSDSTSLFQFLQFPHFQLSASTILEFVSTAHRRRVPLITILENQSNEKVQTIVSLIKKYQDLSVKTPITRWLHRFIIETNYITKLANGDIVANQLKIKNINLFFERLKMFETQNQSAHVTDFVAMLDLWIEAGDNPAQAVIEDVDTVSLLTIHAAKGLEFPVVFVTNLIAGRFPSINRRDPIEFPEELIQETSLPVGSGFIEEERRLLYVAMTRAKDYLYLTYAQNYGGIRTRKGSQFLKETNLPEIVITPKPLQLVLGIDQAPPPKLQPISQKGKINLKSLSYSQIDTFLTCPLKYKYRYLLKVPAEPDHAVSFGQTIHNTLLEFHRHEQQGRDLTVDELLKIYQKCFIDIGYDSPEHKKERFEAGKKALKHYHTFYKTMFAKPRFLEKSLRLSIAGVPLLGKIDRIDQTPEGFEIIDYKTGSTKDQKAVDRDHQLTLYGLAATDALKINVAKMSLFFIETGQKITTMRTEKNYQKEREYLSGMVDKIKKSDFPAKPNYPFPCKFCDYNRICPFAVNK